MARFIYHYNLFGQQLKANSQYADSSLKGTCQWELRQAVARITPDGSTMGFQLKTGPRHLWARTWQHEFSQTFNEIVDDSVPAAYNISHTMGKMSFWWIC